MASGVINLRERYGRAYKITFDPAYDPRRVPRNKLDPWHMQLPGRRGVIYPHGGDLLAVEVDYRLRVANLLAAILGVRLYQDGDREKTFLFPAELFEKVAGVVRPYRRPRVSEVERVRRREQMASRHAAPAA